MSDHQQTYWVECISCSLDEMGIPNALTSEQIHKLAHDVEMGHENIGMAFGYDAIPHPSVARIAEIEQRAARDLKEAKETADIYKKAACNLAHVRPEQVYINNGEAFIDK